MANNERVTKQQLTDYLREFWASSIQTTKIDSEIVKPINEILGEDLYNFAAKTGGLTNAYQNAQFWASDQYSYIFKARASLFSTDGSRDIFFTSSLSSDYANENGYGIVFNKKNRQVNYVDKTGGLKRLFFKL